MKTQSVAIVYRGETDAAIKLAEQLRKGLAKQNIQVVTAPEQKALKGTKMCRPSDLRKQQLVLALGGDGTYLRAVRLLGAAQVPILGINLGSLGFLTPTRTREALSHVLRTLKGDMRLIPRQTLRVQITRKKRKSEVLVLNDVVIERGSLSRIINMSVHCEKQLVSEIKADGLIVSSPTGSTAYNLAAGGPIVHPDASVFLLTPICPHSLTSRVLVMPDDRVLHLKLVGKKQQAHVVADGQVIANLEQGDSIRVQKSSHPHVMVRDPELGYYELLREKLKFGERS